ncbi:aspartic-type endopeptidase [Malassezia pachydermatis]|uniref:Acid protease n=1 Tax=Malassezia pachydermatis TaxID=77020 RepID=A0A0M9VND9_9BASI|nr:acid protease [Malassezia pachydermatis]KOS13262.1 acid protease [Malassezia pachydermatis]
MVMVLAPKMVHILAMLLAMPMVFQVCAAMQDNFTDIALTDSMKMTMFQDDSEDFVHPWIKLQQNINYSKRRMAQAQDKPGPTDEELEEAIAKRAESVRRDQEAQGVKHFEFRPPRVKVGPRAVADDEPIVRSKRFGDNVDNERRSGSGSNRAGRDSDLEARDSSGYSSTAADAENSYSVTEAPNPSARNTAGLAIEANDVGYFVEVQIGSSNSKFKMLIDSGSSDTWVTGSNCNGCGGSNRNKLSTSSSSSLKKSSDSYKISYGTGSVSLTVASDKFQVAGLTLDKFSFGVASSESDDFGDSKIPFDGLIGLGGSGLSVTKKPTLVDALKKANKINQPIVGYRLGRAADGSDSNKGEITFGGVDQSQISGSLTQVDNQSGSGYWMVKLDSVSMDNKQVSGSGTAMLDTGTSLILAPKDAADKIHNSIDGAKSDGQGGYTLPCTSDKQISFSIGGKTFTMDSRDLLFAPKNTNDLTGTCISAISTGNTEENADWLLGAPFLKNVYFATNLDANSIALGSLS